MKEFSECLALWGREDKSRKNVKEGISQGIATVWQWALTSWNKDTFYCSCGSHFLANYTALFSGQVLCKKERSSFSGMIWISGLLLPAHSHSAGNLTVLQCMAEGWLWETERESKPIIEWLLQWAREKPWIPSIWISVWPLTLWVSIIPFFLNWGDMVWWIAYSVKEEMVGWLHLEVSGSMDGDQW